MRRSEETRGSSCRRGTGCAYNIAPWLSGDPRWRLLRRARYATRGGRLLLLRRWRWWRQLARKKKRLTLISVDARATTANSEKKSTLADLLPVTIRSKIRSCHETRAERMIGSDPPLRDFLPGYPLSLLRFTLRFQVIGTCRARQTIPSKASWGFCVIKLGCNIYKDHNVKFTSDS